MNCKLCGSKAEPSAVLAIMRPWCVSRGSYGPYECPNCGYLDNDLKPVKEAEE